MERNGWTYTIGFYGPQNGPEPPKEPTVNPSGSYPWNDPIIKEIHDDWKHPYAEIRATDTSGTYYFSKLSRLAISRTGKIYESVSDAWCNYYNYEAYKSSFRSFNVSFSSDDFLIISDATNDYMNGTYRRDKYDPNNKFDEGFQELWKNIKNTAWTKQGDSKPSIGFYELSAGPSPAILINDNSYLFNECFGYAYFMTPDGSSNRYMLNNKDGVFIQASNISFYISSDGNTLTISNIRLPLYNDKTKVNFLFDDSFAEYTEEEFGAFFNGIYTKAEFDYNENKRDALWNQIKNTAWTKQGETFPSVGFYLNGNGPESASGNTDGDGYVYFMSPDGASLLHLVIKKTDNISYDNNLSININGDIIKAGTYRGRTSFKITVSNNGNTINISNILLPGYEERSENDEIIGRYKVKIPFYPDYHIYNYNDFEYTAMYTEAQFGAYFNGTYTKHSSDPKYAFDERREQLWNKLKNTAWKNSSSSKPSIGFYEWDKGPDASYYNYDESYAGYVYFLTPDGYSIRNDIKYYINKYGNSISLSDLKICNIEVSGNNTITISNMRDLNFVDEFVTFRDNVSREEKRYNSTELGRYFIGTFTKTPDDDWNN
jgi:hypothetical protein